jgi:biopolymer transport protein ExbB/TolQ
MLTQTLLRFTDLGEDWILYILFGLSLASVAIMLERLIFFSMRRVRGIEGIASKLLAGDLEGARGDLAHGRGMESKVMLAAIAEASKGPGTVEEIIASGIASQRLGYERSLAFLGTLGNNAPFVGLLGTVLGIIRAFQDLSVATPGSIAKGPQTVMAGISSALVATAVGLFVALPAVVAFNGFQRWLKSITSRTHVLGHALVAHLRERRD